eukprot:PITA_16286
MVGEYSSIMTNSVWEVVSRPKDRSVVGFCCIYNIKYVANGSMEKYKARFMAKGYALKEGIDYEETNSRVAKYTFIRLCEFTDADWASSLVDKKSTSGGCFNIGSRVVLWCSRKQKLVPLNSAEAEYMEISTTTSEAKWLQKLLLSLFGQRMEVTNIYCDNQSCIRLSKNPVFHDRSKHINIQYHFIRGCVQRGAIQLQDVPTKKQVADIQMKALGRATFVYFGE